MTRVVLVLLVVAVAVLAVRDRRRERRLAQVEQELATVRPDPVHGTATDTIAKTLKGAALGQFIPDPLKRQIGPDAIFPSEAARRKSLEPLCTRMHMNGLFPPVCDGVGIAVAPEPMPKGLDVE